MSGAIVLLFFLSQLLPRHHGIVDCLPLHPLGFGSAKHVLIIGIDGLGTVHLTNATHILPNLARFYDEGSVALPGVARSEVMSISAPNWGSAITGLSLSQTGILDNTWKKIHTVPSSSSPSCDGNTRHADDRKCNTNINYTQDFIDKELKNDTITVPSMSIVNSYSVKWDPSDSTKETHKVLPTHSMDALWDVAKKQCPSIKAAVVYSWPWIGDWLSPGSVEWSYNCNGDDETCADKLISYIKDGKPDISFVHFDSVDFAGHIHGFGGPQYYDNLKLVDGYIGMILDVLDESGMFNDTLIMVLSDHGGFRHSHGYFNQENIFIPALFLGPGVRRNATLTRYISIMDFTPTALNALGLRPTDEMRGKIVEEIYRSDHL